MRSHARYFFAALAVSTLACGPSPETPRRTRTYSFEALAGISMGAIGTSWLAGEGGSSRLDSIAMLGGPIDAAYFLSNMERNLMGGFCSLAELEALALENPAALNDPKALDCEKGRTYYAYELPQNYNHWRFTQSGGAFDRNSYLDIFEDLSLASGNPVSPNALSGVFASPEFTKARHTGAICDNPIVLKGVKHKEYNPEGKYDLITFCDGQAIPWYCDDEEMTPVDFCENPSPQAFCAARNAIAKQASSKANENPELYLSQMGRYDPCRTYTRPVTFGFAVDINGNGKRDYHEPIAPFGHERFDDVGSDGCSDEFEDGQGGCTATGQTGDPNGDNFDPWTNPLGTEGNFRYDAGEPFEDFGLDGVPNTGDLGEGDGVYTDAPHRARWFRRDLRETFLSMTQDELKSLDVYTDGGIRDVFNLGLSGDIIHSALRALVPEDSRRWTSFLDIPTASGDPWESGFFDASLADYGRIGRNAFIRYGSADQTAEEIDAGAGDHVGSMSELVARFGAYQYWQSHVWELPLGESEPIRSVAPPQEEIIYYSEALGAPRNFSLALPPGYDLPENADVRYPVFLLSHGYGMDAANMSMMQILFNNYMESGEIRPMIIGYPSGRCCYVRPDGSKDCRENDDDGTSLAGKPGYVRECIKGNFYQNRVGYTVGEDTSRYGDAIFEILDHIKKNYRTLAPMTVEVP